MRENPYSYRRKGTEEQWKRKARKIGDVAVYSILRDWIKAQVTAIETGLLTFEGVFMPHMLLPNGKRLLDHIEDVHQMLEHKP